MRQKDKEAFDEWLNKERRIFEANEPATFCDADEFCMEKGWQAACEYKNKEIMNEVRQTPSGVSVVKFNKELVRKEIEKLQAEIKKLREGCCCSAEEQYTCIKCRWGNK
jgi:hypothetical protein